MKAVILVAGMSRRMGSLTESLPKTLLPLNGTTILFQIVTSLKQCGLNEVVFVCGYRSEQIRSYVKSHFPELKTEWVTNPKYAETNTSSSVLLTQPVIDAYGGPILLINGDVVFDSRVIQRTLDAPQDTVLATRLDRVDEEEVKVRIDMHDRILEIGKHIPPRQAAGESVGINRLSKRVLTNLYPILSHRVYHGKGKQEFYEASFNQLIQEGLPFHIADITEFPVMEIDTPEDYEEVKNTIVPLLQ